MPQLLCHLLGDYVLQTDWMARHKTQSSFVAAAHAVTYSLLFLLLSPTTAAFTVILVTHFFIDRFRLARFVVFAKNRVTDTQLRWADVDNTGQVKDTPPWMSIWLLIIVDNTLHLCINYAALACL